jgi:hypothetical protein
MYGSATASSANLPRDVRCRARISSFRERRDLALAYLRYAVGIVEIPTPREDPASSETLAPAGVLAASVRRLCRLGNCRWARQGN